MVSGFAMLVKVKKLSSRRTSGTATVAPVAAVTDAAKADDASDASSSKTCAFNPPSLTEKDSQSGSPSKNKQLGIASFVQRVFGVPPRIRSLVKPQSLTYKSKELTTDKLSKKTDPEKLPSSSKKSLAKKTILMLMMGGCLGALVWIIITRIKSSTSSSSPNGSSIGYVNSMTFANSPLVVTNLILTTSGKSQDDAMETCSDESYTSGLGVNLYGDDEPDQFAFFCQQQQPLFALDSQAQVLHSLAVIDTSNGQTCAMIDSASAVIWIQVFTPKVNVEVCASYVTAAQALQTGHFVRSVTTSYHTKYFMRGWQLASDVSVSLIEDYEIYLATLTPPLPLTDIRRLTPSQRTSDTTDPCAQTYGSLFNLAAGFINSSQDVLCISKGEPNQWTNEFSVLQQSIIVDLELIASTSVCSDPTNDRVEFSPSLAQNLVLCISRFNGSQVGSLLPSNSFVTDLFVDVSTSTSSSQLIKSVGAIQFDHGGQLFLARSSGVQSIDLTLTSMTSSSYTDLLTSNRTRTKRLPLRARLETREDQSQFLAFRIVQFADVHFTGKLKDQACRSPPYYMDPDDCSEALTPPFMEKILDLEQPDLVVFTGDNTEVDSVEGTIEALDYITQIVESRGIPYAMVFGNHDTQFADDGIAVKTEVMQYLMENKPLFLGEIGPEDVDGVGNYVLRVMNPVNTSDAELSLYFLDSHDRRDSAEYPDVHSYYDWIHQSQIDLYLQNANQIIRQHPDRIPLAMMFFHIPLPEYGLDSNLTRHGSKMDDSAPARLNSQLVDTLLTMKEVKAVFVGHDHSDDYCYLHHGSIQLCYGGGVGFGQAYGYAHFARRTRVIEWTEEMASGQRELTSWKRLYESVESRSMAETLYMDE